MSQTIKVTQGLPASGKTTWARKWVNEDPKNRVRINRDDIRKMLGPYWIPTREKLVTSIENDMLIQSLFRDYDVVIDATNLRGIDRFKTLLYKNALDSVELELVDHFLEVDLKTCIQRDQQRSGDAFVGKEPITRMYNKYLKDNGQ